VSKKFKINIHYDSTSLNSSQNEKCFSQESYRKSNNTCHVPFITQCGKKYCRAGRATGDTTIWRMRTACWISKATNTHSDYVILIAFPLQQQLYVTSQYTACLVTNSAPKCPSEFAHNLRAASPVLTSYSSFIQSHQQS
jgi:hypothetical protein